MNNENENKIDEIETLDFDVENSNTSNNVNNENESFTNNMNSESFNNQNIEMLNMQDNQNVETLNIQDNQDIEMIDVQSSNDADLIKYYKKKKIIKIAIILVFLIVVGVVLFILFKPKSTSKPTPAPIVDNQEKFLVCTNSEYNEDLDANIDSEYKLQYLTESNYSNVSSNLNYQFNSIDAYINWKDSINLDDNTAIETIIFDFNDELMRYQITDSNDTLVFVPEGSAKDYNSMERFFLDLGYTCNGKNKNDSVPKESNVGKIFAINESINVVNNYFEYSNYIWELFDENDVNSKAILWMGTIKNIGSERQIYNFNIKFYDENQECIGQYQIVQDTSVESNYLEPGEVRDISVTLDLNVLYDDYNMHDVKFISLENIV